MKKILLILLTITSLSSFAQTKQYYDEKKGKYYADELKVTSTYSAEASLKMMVIDTVTKRVYHQVIPTGGSGEVNTASNLGGGIANYSTKVGSDLRFNSFSSTNFSLTSNVLSLVDNTSIQKVSISNAGSVIGSRKEINFIPAGNIGWTVTDNAGADRVDVTPIVTAPSGVLIGIQYITSGTSYTPTSGTNKVLLILVGGGGGGGGASGANTSVGAGAGGGAGGILQSFVSVTNTAYTYAIGGAGAAGTNTGGNGGAGGNTTITIDGTTYTANGGGGGIGQTAGTAAAVTLGGTTGTSTNGSVNGGGQNGDNGVRLSGTVGISGAGGTSFYGRGGAALSSAAAGNAATGFGAGGGGALSTANLNRLGGAGSQGLMIVYEYR